MNNIFNLNRFILLFKKHTIEHAKTYLLSIVVLAGILALTLGFFSFTGHGNLNVKSQDAMFLFFLLGAGGIFTSLTFSDLSDKKQAISVLTLPASHLEKFLVKWMYSYIIFQLVFIGVFYFVDWIVIGVSFSLHHDDNEVLNILDEEPIRFAFLAYAVFHAFAIWGAIFFEKLHFIKTAFVFIIYLLVILLISEPLLQLIIGEKNIGGIAFGSIGPRIIRDNQFWSVLPTDGMRYTNLAILTICVIIFWMSAFSRLKEKEV